MLSRPEPQKHPQRFGQSDREQPAQVAGRAREELGLGNRQARKDSVHTYFYLWRPTQAGTKPIGRRYAETNCVSKSRKLSSSYTNILPLCWLYHPLSGHQDTP